MKQNEKIIPVVVLVFSFFVSAASLAQEINYNCWKSQKYTTLLDTMLKVMLLPIEDTYKQHDHIQTFGCAYEEDDIEQNSIRAVYRAIIQSIRNRKVKLRDDLDTIIESNPPRPDNLAREYSIYVNIPVQSDFKAARYEIKILNLEAVPTIESEKAVWTRIVTRYAYKEDYNIAPIAEQISSEFVKVMGEAQDILKTLEKRKFNKLRKVLNIGNEAIEFPRSIEELKFGDSMILFDEVDLEKAYPGIYLGKGIFTCETPNDGIEICKFGEERLFQLRIDTNSFRRTTPLYAELNYQAPESILECLFLKYCHEKPKSLPSLGVVR